MNAKELKEKVQEIINSGDFSNCNDFINELISDSRKSIISLGEKLQRTVDKNNDEIKRVRALYDFDKSYNYEYVMGVDEVGRGPLAGPIVACGVILNLNVLDNELILGLNDSKKINPKKREMLSEIIKEKALAYYIAECSNIEIDEKGIAYANNKVFLDCSENIKIKPNLVLSDGYKVKGIKIDNTAVIKGDTKSASIAAASIVAKVYRDKLMEEYAKKYPYYGFEENAGYGTKKHIDGINEHGICDIHRKCFLNNILKDEL